MNHLLSEIISHADPSQVADIFLEKPRPLHDLLQKAAGRMLRYASGELDSAEYFISDIFGKYVYLCPIQIMLVLQILAVILAIVGIIGSVVPALPGPPLGWAAMLCVFFCNGSNAAGEPMTLACLLIWLGIMVLVTVLDYIVPAYMTKATGGHKAASRGAMIGLILGIFFTPVGMILGSLIGAFVGEFIFADSGVWTSFKASIGTFLGFITGTLMKLVVSAAMAWYVVVYLN